MAAIGCLLAPAPASALDPEVRLTQYRHTAWRVQDGSFASAPMAIAQTADGYIWIGTTAGLVRYDGVRFTPWIRPGETVPFSAAVYSLLSSSDGTLWIGTAARLYSFKDNKVDEHVRGRINAIIEDRQRRIWVARSRPPDSEGGLCQAVGEKPRCIGGDDRLRLPYAVSLSEDGLGNLWVGASSQLLRWSDGAHHSYFREQLAPFEGTAGVDSVLTMPDGSIWSSIARAGFGVFRIVNGVPEKMTFKGANTENVNGLFVDRDRSVWMATSNDGIYRVSKGRLDHFRGADGLSSNAATGFFEDREGSLWVATTKGLDRFRDARVVTFSTAEGLSADFASSVLASDDGRVWIGNMGGLDVVDGAHVTSIRTAGQNVTSLWQDHAKRLWVGLDNELTLYEGGQFRKVIGLDGRSLLGIAVAITEDRDHNLWVSIAGAKRKLLRIRDLAVQEEFSIEQIPYARVLAADPGGGIWMGLLNGQLGHYRGGKFEAFPLPLGDAPVLGVMVDADGSVWVSNSRGLARLKNREVTTLTTRNGLPCDSLVSAIRDRKATLWLYTKCGLIAIDGAELDRWSEQPGRAVQYRIFDVLDGAMPGTSSFQPGVSISPDGRLWFVNDAVVQMLDPGGLRMNTVVPPVYVEGLRADRRDYSIASLVRLPARSRDLEISYTALSLAVPEKVRFRYRLEGRDQEWNDAGTRRQAFYSDLPPGEYRFRVTASTTTACGTNRARRSTSWSHPRTTRPAGFSPSPPAMLFAGAGPPTASACASSRGHQREISALNERLMKAQEQERIRIAGELHDGVMQEMLAATMMLGSAKRRTPGIQRRTAPSTRCSRN